MAVCSLAALEPPSKCLPHLHLLLPCLLLVMPPSTKDFVLEQQKELLPGWSSTSQADAAPQTVDKALKALNKERQKQINAQLNKNVANQLAMQLDALQDERMAQKQARRSQAAQSGSVHVDADEPRCVSSFTVLHHQIKHASDT